MTAEPFTLSSEPPPANRQWLIRERNYKGDGPPPALPDEIRIDIARIYLNAFERITGTKFDAKV